MINSFCRSKDFEYIKEYKNGFSTVKFSKEPVLNPILDSEGKETGEYETTNLVSFTLETLSTEKLTPENIIKIRLKELENYDTSENVNSFIVNGKSLWFDKVTRTCIVYSIQAEKENGSTTTTLYDNDGFKYIIPIDVALLMFNQLELYAKTCYNVTAEHKVNLNNLTSIEDILEYNIKTGYPEKLNFDISEN